MLKQLTISNYALIDRTHIEFDSGMSVITGETGAGKSILLGALGLILGQRADAQALLDKTQKCVVEGVFDLSEHHLEQLFAENDIDFELQTIIRREVLPNGKSRAFVNDTPAPAAFLKSIAQHIIDVHSQHQNLLLGNDSYQMMIVDTVADNGNERASYSEAYERYRALRHQIEKMTHDNEKLKSDADYIAFQHQQLAEAKLKDGELAELEAELEQQTHAEEIQTALATVTQLLDGSDTAVAAMLQTAAHAIEKIAEFMPADINAAARIETARIDLTDLCREMSRLADSTEYNAERATFLQQRVDNIYMLLQKHRVQTVAELIEIEHALAAQLESITNFDAELEQLNRQAAEAFEVLTARGKSLTASRCKTFERITSFITAQLKELGMPNANFVVSHTLLAEPSASGFDDVRMLFAANKNGQPADITKVASGGEMSRVMLSIKSLLSESKGLPTIIFDEIDTGVSGEIADKMGGIMMQMARNMQVIAITHLPQVAAKGARHYKVFKTDHADRTISNITLLDSGARVDEIAKMLSGATISEAARLNAQELLGK